MTALARLLVIIILVLLPVAPCYGGAIEDIKEKQKGLVTVKALFKQEKRTELLERPIKSEGKFYFKSPVGVRWEYDDAMVVVYDGKSLYLHYTELDEAEKIDGVSGYVGPLSFDIERILEEYDATPAEAGGGYSILLRPKKRMPFETMEMFFPRGAAFPGEIRMTEETGDVTVITFSDIKTNVKLPDSLFVFTPPPGVVLRERHID